MTAGLGTNLGAGTIALRSGTCCGGMGRVSLIEMVLRSWRLSPANGGPGRTATGGTAATAGVTGNFRRGHHGLDPERAPQAPERDVQRPVERPKSSPLAAWSQSLPAWAASALEFRQPAQLWFQLARVRTARAIRHRHWCCWSALLPTRSTS